MQNKNPFVIIGYQGPDNFCDREKELTTLQEAVNNNRNITLYADRRIGKTGLIMHFFQSLNKDSSWLSIYIDVLPFLSAHNLITRMANEFVQKFANEKNVLQKALTALSGLRPKVTIDPLSGSPTLELDVRQVSDLQPGLQNLMALFASNRKKVIIALDEFQQISTFEDLDAEALIRSLAQQHANIRFIYSGSKKHLLLSMFTQRNRPFYQSTQLLELGSLPDLAYESFIITKFSRNNRKITSEAINTIFHITKRQTYYCQLICNRLFSKGYKTIKLNEVHQIIDDLFAENKPIYYNYRNLLTKGQWGLLQSIAHEDKVYQPTAKSFIQQYALGAASSISRALSALIEKGMITQNLDSEGKEYFAVEDALFAEWLKRN